MPDSLIEQLPKIVAEGKKEAERILNELSEKEHIVLQTNEYVLPSKERSGLFRGTVKEIDKKEWFNRLIYGDNLLVMQALLTGDPSTGLPTMRGGIDLIYIDPPFDSKADYRTKITLPNGDIEQKPTACMMLFWASGGASSRCCMAKFMLRYTSSPEQAFMLATLFCACSLSISSSSFTISVSNSVILSL